MMRTMRSTTTYRRGGVIVVNVPFSDHSGTKKRPAIIVSADNFHRTLPDVIVCPISSRPRYFERPGAGDLPLRSWKAAGLRYPSTVRISRTLAIDKNLVGRVLGRLSSEELNRVESALRLALAL
jgi:mRNA interferase MazF